MTESLTIRIHRVVMIVILFESCDEWQLCFHINKVFYLAFHCKLRVFVMEITRKGPGNVGGGICCAYLSGGLMADLICTAYHGQFDILMG